MIFNGESMKALTSPVKEINITYAPLDEQLLTTPVELGISEPVSPTFSYTVAESNLPIVEGAVGYHNVGILYACGFNSDASNQLLHYTALLNSESIATGSSYVVAGKYYSLRISSPSLLDVAVGDVIDVKLCGTNPSILDWSYCYLALCPTRIDPLGDVRKVAYNIHAFVEDVDIPCPTLGNPSRYTIGNPYTYGAVINNLGVVLSCNIGETIIGLEKSHVDYGMFRFTVGDTMDSSLCMSSSYYPFYQACRELTKITYQLIDVDL